MKYKFVQKGEFVFHVKDDGDYFYMIFDGAVNVYVPKTEDEIYEER